MTTPAPTQQTNKKAWVATIGGLIGAAIPLIAQLAGVLPPPYGAIVSGIVALISLVTGKATHQVSNAPKGTVLVPASADGTYTNPWKTDEA